MERTYYNLQLYYEYSLHGDVNTMCKHEPKDCLLVEQVQGKAATLIPS